LGVSIGIDFRGSDGWSMCNPYGKLKVTPEEEELKFELYIGSRQYHSKNGLIKYRKGVFIDLTKKIPYEKLKGLLEESF